MLIGQVARDEPFFPGLALIGVSTSVEDLRRAVEGGREAFDRRRQERFNARALAIWPFGPQYFFCNHPVRGIADLRGLKVRSYTPSMTAFLQHAGAIPVTLQFSEVYPALQCGLVTCGITSAVSACARNWAAVITHPGTAAAAAVQLDGHALARMGQTRRALEISLFASVTGDMLATLGLIVAATWLATVALRFGPPKFVMLYLVVLVTIASVAGNSFPKAMLATGAGFLVACIGLDPMSGQSRFTFDSYVPTGGIGFIPPLIGLFALGEIFAESGKQAPTRTSSIVSGVPTARSTAARASRLFSAMDRRGICNRLVSASFTEVSLIVSSRYRKLLPLAGLLGPGRSMKIPGRDAARSRGRRLGASPPSRSGTWRRCRARVRSPRLRESSSASRGCRAGRIGRRPATRAVRVLQNIGGELPPKSSDIGATTCTARSALPVDLRALPAPGRGATRSIVRCAQHRRPRDRPIARLPRSPAARRRTPVKGGARPAAYLAGPDVFLPDAAAHAARKMAVCAKYGIVGRAPLNEDVEALAGMTDEDAWRTIFRKDLALMEACDLVIANLTPFRGPSADAGTLVELGWFLGRGRPVFGYSNTATPFAARSDAHVARFPDPMPGLSVEGFGLPDNLMVPGAVLFGGGHPIVVPLDGLDRCFGALDVFERCVAAAALALGARVD